VGNENEVMVHMQDGIAFRSFGVGQRDCCPLDHRGANAPAASGKGKGSTGPGGPDKGEKILPIPKRGND